MVVFSPTIAVRSHTCTVGMQGVYDGIKSHDDEMTNPKSPVNEGERLQRQS